MTAYEAARKWDVPTNRVSEWIRRGRIDAVRVQFGNTWKWIIADDHPMPVTSTNGVPSEARQKVVLRNYGKRGYVAKFAGTFSVKHMAKFLETTCAEVRITYDDIVAKGGF